MRSEELAGSSRDNLHAASEDDFERSGAPKPPRVGSGVPFEFLESHPRGQLGSFTELDRPCRRQSTIVHLTTP